jgi:hypothetical protein
LGLKDKHCLPNIELRVKTLEMHRGRGGTPGRSEHASES